MLTDNVIVERLRQSNTEFRELEESHHRLDLELNELQKRHVLTNSSARIGITSTRRHIEGCGRESKPRIPTCRR
jgi:hypothetical protein